MPEFPVTQHILHIIAQDFTFRILSTQHQDIRISIKSAYVTSIILESKISRDHSPMLNQQSLERSNAQVPRKLRWINCSKSWVLVLVVQLNYCVTFETPASRFVKWRYHLPRLLHRRCLKAALNRRALSIQNESVIIDGRSWEEVFRCLLASIYNCYCVVAFQKAH